MTYSEPAASNHDQAGRLGVLVEEILAELPQETALAIRVSSVPRRLPRTLLDALVAPASLAEEVWSTLLELGFVRPAPRSHTVDGEEVRFHTSIRAHLRTTLREAFPARFVEANRVALDSFQRRAAHEPSSIAEEETVYHLLSLDEAAGLALLREEIFQHLLVHRREAAELLLNAAEELAPELSAQGQAWLRYHRGQLHQAYRQADWGEEAFRAAAGPDAPSLLRIYGAWSLGMLRVEQGRWTEGLGHFQQGRVLARDHGGPWEEALLAKGMAHAYQDLAVRSGGFIETPSPWRRVWGWLVAVVLLPFLLYKRLVNVLPFLPNWYFGGSYQDWIIASLYNQALRWDRRAEASLRGVSSQGSSVLGWQVQTEMGAIERRLGLWRRAEKRFRRLSHSSPVTQSAYRTAQLHLEQGQLALERGKLIPAEGLLQSARGVMVKVDDLQSLATAARALARVYTAQGKPSQALDAYETALAAWKRTDDHQSQTLVLWEMEQLQVRHFWPAQEARRVTELVTSVAEEEYVARFPGPFLRVFRRLFLTVTLPLGYLLTLLLTPLFTQLSLKVFEGEVLLLLHGQFSLPTLADWIALAYFFFFPFLILWSYHLLYATVGYLFADFQVRRRVGLEREQPRFHRLTDDGLSSRSAGAEEIRQVAWPEVRRVFLRDYTLLGAPLALFSRTVVQGGGAQGNADAVEIAGAVAGYRRLQTHLLEHVHAAQTSLPPVVWQTFSVFAPGWMAAVALAAGLVSWAAFEKDYWGGISVYAAPFLAQFAWAFLVLYPFTLLGRLLWRRMRTPGEERPRPLVPTWVLGLGVFLQGVVVLVWALLVWDLM